MISFLQGSALCNEEMFLTHHCTTSQPVCFTVFMLLTIVVKQWHLNHCRREPISFISLAVIKIHEGYVQKLWDNTVLWRLCRCVDSTWQRQVCMMDIQRSQ